MLKLFKYLKPYWLEVLILLLSIAAQTWFTLQLPALMADIVNYGVSVGDEAVIWQIGSQMLLYTLISSICAVLSGYLSSRVGAAFSRDLRRDFYARVINMSVDNLDKFSTASLITRTTNDISQVQQVIIMMLSMMLRAPMMCILAIVQAFNTAPDMTYIIALAVGIILVLVVIIISSVIPKFKLFQKLIDRLTLLTRENLTGLRVIRAFNNEPYEKRKFVSANDELTKTIIAINKILSLNSPLLSLIFNAISLACIWLGISLIPSDPAYLGNMMAFMQYAIQVVMSFLVLTFFFMMLPRANVSAGRINEVLRSRDHIKWRDKTLGTPNCGSTIEFRNVSFSFAHAEQKVLDDVSFKAKAGETVAIIGSTGSGKSALVNLIPRFREVTSGEILVDDINIKDYSREDLMRRIGFVPQRGVLFSGTVRSNITFGAPDISDEEIKKAARIAQASDFIEKIGGLDAHISQGGTNVSGGQKQRLSIARAIAKKPEFYIFDDSFSALDMQTDKKLREALKPETKDSVVLIVAQRASTIRDADQIIVLEKGKIVGQGTHQSLLKHCKVYQEIVRSQLSEEEYKQELKNVK